MRTKIQIFTVLNGWVVQAGCQLIVYTDRDKLLTDFADYTNDPVGTERRILAKALNRKVTLPSMEEGMMAATGVQSHPTMTATASGYAAAQSMPPSAPPPHELIETLHNQSR